MNRGTSLNPACYGGIGATVRYWAVRGLALAIELQPWVLLAIGVDFLSGGALFAPLPIVSELESMTDAISNTISVLPPGYYDLGPFGGITIK
jgi:hypothetical protein